MNFRKAAFMLRKLRKDISSRGNFREKGKDFTSQELGSYYLVFQDRFDKLNPLLTSFDAEGIPLNSAYIDVEDNALHYYPISIGQYGLALFESWLRSGDLEKRDHFLKIAGWFCGNAVQEEHMGTFWLTAVPKPEYGVHEPWKSAFTQSRGLSVLLRAWQLTADKRYLLMAQDALRPFCLDIAEGGVSVDRNLGKTFYEEYVALAPTRVLDGHCFSLFGLFDFVRAVPENVDAEGHELARSLFDQGITGLEKRLPDFDLGYWVRFNLCDLPGYPDPDPCTVNYLTLVITQLDILASITNSKVLREYERQFRGYLTYRNIFRMYPVKMKALKKINRL